MSMSTTKDLNLGSLNLDQEEDEVPQPRKTMADLPPEVVTKILEQLPLYETRNNLLSYRLVSPQWKDILDSLLEKKLESGRLQPFPAMSIGGEGVLLHVYCSLTLFYGGENPFPFNSLMLNGNAELNFWTESPTDTLMLMYLPDFISKFGENLTSFALHNLIFPIDTLGAMIGSLPQLKLLSLMNVMQEKYVIHPDAVLLAPPRLPCLSTLEVKSTHMNHRGREVGEKRNMLYVWLIASYADQLVRLLLDTWDPFPPLRKRHKYIHSFPNGRSFSIATTSDLAFGNLKELQISHPSGNFLNHSETPALQQLSVIDFVVLRDLIRFVVKCGAILEKLSLDLTWEEMETTDFFHSVHHGGPTEIVVLPKLKTLAIHYPSDDFQEMILGSELLVMIPALELLQLLHFQPHDCDREIPVEEMVDGENEVRADDDLVALKERCAVLRRKIKDILEDEADAWNDVRLHKMNSGFGRGRGRRRRDPRKNVQYRIDKMVFEAHAEELSRQKRIAQTERERIFQRLAAPWEKRENVVVEQLLERQGVWNTCPNLRIVSVSSEELPAGDICVVRRMDIA